MEKAQAICLASGGLDSAVTIALALKEGYSIYMLYIDYGQHTSQKELSCAREQAAYFQAKEFRIVPFPWLRQIGGSGMIDDGVILTPENAALEYVPFRNTILLSMAVAWAEVLRAESVFIGSIGGPWITPDNSPAYFEAFQQVVKIGTKLKNDIAIRAPFCRSTKTDVVKKGAELHVPFHITWSCQNFNDEACGKCSNCRDRLQAFASLGLTDPISYRGHE